MVADGVGDGRVALAGVDVARPVEEDAAAAVGRSGLEDPHVAVALRLGKAAVTKVLIHAQLGGQDICLRHVAKVLRAVLVEHAREARPQVGFEREGRRARELVDLLMRLEPAEVRRLHLPSAPEDGPVVLLVLDAVVAVVAQDHLHGADTSVVSLAVQRTAVISV